MRGDACIDFPRGLMQVDHDAGIQFIRERHEPRERGVAQIVGRERCECGRYQRIALVGVAQAQRVRQGLRRVLGPGRGAVRNRHPQHRAHTLFNGRARGFFGEEAAIAEACDSGQQHFGDGRQGAVAREIRIDQPIEGRCAAIGAAQQQRGRGRRCVDHARHEQMRISLQNRPGRITLRREGAR